MALSLLATISGCGNNLALSNIGAMADLVTSTEEDQPIDRQAVENLPYATIAAKIGDAPRAVLVLGRYEGRELHWFAANNVALAFRDGRLIQTAGLAPDLTAAFSSYVDPIANHPQRLQPGTPYEWEIEIDGQPRRNVVIKSNFFAEATETIVIADISYDTLRLREEASAIGINWTFENYYWVDIDTGFLWQSRQHTLPGEKPIEVQVLKPAARR